MPEKDEESQVEMEVWGESLALLAEQQDVPMSEEKFRKTHSFQPGERGTLWRRVRLGLTWDSASLLGLVPIVAWLPRYDLRASLLGDLIAGLTVSVLQIPHGLAFAPLGGQAPVVGLYMAVFPLVVYTLMGTSRHISLGMMGILIIMVGKVVDTHAVSQEALGNGTVGYSALEVGIAVTFTIGAWQLLLGALQLGSLCVLLSTSLVSGFTSGASIHIIFIQLKHIFGIQIAMPTGPFKLFYIGIEFFQNVGNTNVMSMGISFAFMAVLFLFNEWVKPKMAKVSSIPVPMEFIAIGVSIALCELLDLAEHGVQTVGTVPGGLPQVLAPPFALMPAIATDCLVIALVSVSVNISLAKMLAKKAGYEVQENQELLAYGVSNMAGGFFQCLPVSASLSRSMVQFAVGGKTELAHAVSLLSVLVMLLFLGPLFEKVPLSVLAAIVIVTIKGLLAQIGDVGAIWRASRLDGAVWLATFWAVVLLDIDYGIGIGLVASVVVLVVSSVGADVQVLGLAQQQLVDTRCYPTATTHSKVIIFKIIGGINFYNSPVIMSKINKALTKFWEKSREKSDTVATFAIIDLSAVPYLDPAGAADLSKLFLAMASNNCDMILTNCSSNVYQALASCDNKFPTTSIMISVNAALEYLHDKKLN